jgi:hypothetical protein
LLHLHQLVTPPLPAQQHRKGHVKMMQTPAQHTINIAGLEEMAATMVAACIAQKHSMPSEQASMQARLLTRCSHHAIA